MLFITSSHGYILLLLKRSATDSENPSSMKNDFLVEISE